VPLRIHIFLCLMANNKTLTRDNLAKRKTVEDSSCLFCDDKESIHHLFFECCVAKHMWQVCSDISRKTWGLILNRLQNSGCRIRD
jgi:hypothetical protein